MQQWVAQEPDSLANAASRLVAKTEENEYCFKEMLSKLMDESLKSDRMGDENIWALLAEKYIFDKNAIWVDSAQTAVLKQQYERIKSNLIGMQAHDLTLQTIDGKAINTNDIQAKYLILYFYDPDCAHCQTATPEFHDKLYANYKSKGVETVAINIGNDNEKWNAFVKDKKLTDWINCSDPGFKSQYWIYYNVSSLPTVYVLDENKKIVAKGLDEQNLEKFFNFYFDNKNGVN
jgi:peroxiredoxin